MNKKSRKLIAELVVNSRATSKELGKKLRTSQQSVNYLIHSLEKNKIIKRYITVFDNSKFGLINFIVLVRFKSLEKENEILKYLKENENVIKIEKLSIGWDFLVIFSTSNISHFNKSLREFLIKFKVDRFVVLPIIVKYDFRKTSSGIPNILFGDREKIDLNKKEIEICKMLRDNGRSSYLKISKKTGLDPKTVVEIKKRLEKKGVIKGYSIIFNHSKLNIRRFILLIKLRDYSLEADKEFIEYCKMNKNVVSLFKCLGEWDVVLEIELENKTLVEFLKEFRENIIEDYNSSITNEIIKSCYLPESVFE